MLMGLLIDCKVLSGMVAMVVGVIGILLAPTPAFDDDSSPSWFHVWSKWMVVICNLSA
jgi:hypothetical protein